MPKVLAVGRVRRIRAVNGILFPATSGIISFVLKSWIICDHGISVVVVVVYCGSLFALSDGSGGMGDVVKSLVGFDVSNGCDGPDVSQLVAKMPANSRDITIKIETIRRTDCNLRWEMLVFMYSSKNASVFNGYTQNTLFYYILSCERLDVIRAALYP